NGSQAMLYMAPRSGNDGAYSLTVTFEIGTDKNIDAIEVQNRVSIAQTQLPADVIRNGITVRKSSGSAAVVSSSAGSAGSGAQASRDRLRVQRLRSAYSANRVRGRSRQGQV